MVYNHHLTYIYLYFSIATNKHESVARKNSVKNKHHWIFKLFKDQIVWKLSILCIIAFITFGEKYITIDSLIKRL